VKNLIFMVALPALAVVGLFIGGYLAGMWKWNRRTRNLWWLPISLCFSALFAGIYRDKALRKQANKTNPLLSAVSGGRYSAYILDVSDKSGTPQAVRCGEMLIQVGDDIFNDIDRQVLALNFFDPNEGSVIKFFAYPVTAPL